MKKLLKSKDTYKVIGIMFLFITTFVIYFIIYNVRNIILNIILYPMKFTGIGVRYITKLEEMKKEI